MYALQMDQAPGNGIVAPVAQEFDRSTEEHSLQLICRSVIRETPSMSSFVLERADCRPFHFKAGQHLIIQVEIDGTVHHRCYSISSSPSQTGRIHLTVNRVTGGLVSNWLHDRLHAGMELTATGPRGSFNIEDLPAERPLMLSGGSGITPIMSMLRWLADTGALADAVLMYFCRAAEDFAFRGELEALARAHPGLRLHLVLSRADASGWQGRSGRISADLLRETVPDAASRTAYVCGSEGFMLAARAAAVQAGVGTIHAESFGGMTDPHNSADMATTGTKGMVTFADSGQTYECTVGETVLDAAAASGIWISAACRQGVCGTCKGRLVSGSVSMNDLGGLTDAEKAEGWILPCCSLPIGPVTVQLRA